MLRAFKTIVWSYYYRGLRGTTGSIPDSLDLLSRNSLLIARISAYGELLQAKKVSIACKSMSGIILRGNQVKLRRLLPIQ